MIKIDTTSFIPIYEQIKKQIKSSIAMGSLKPDELLPSIRDLAAKLVVNPNTVARAYRELEMEGFIYTRKGMGCYVSDNSDVLIEKERQNILNRVFDDAIKEAYKFDFQLDEIEMFFRNRIKTFAQEQKGE